MTCASHKNVGSSEPGDRGQIEQVHLGITGWTELILHHKSQKKNRNKYLQKIEVNADNKSESNF